MRRQLITVFVAISMMVAVAFVVPLGFLVRSTARDRAIDAARADASALVPVIVSGGTREQIELAVGATPSGGAGRLTVLTSSGWRIGPEVADSAAVTAALERGSSSIAAVEGGVEVIATVASGPGDMSVIRVLVPDEDLRRGQSVAWAALAGVALALVTLSVVVADRLARSIVRPTQDLADAAHRLGDGDLSTRVATDGPPELVDLATAFNSLGTQVSSMLDRERELVAELSHRLRTPLTKLRLRVDQVAAPDLADELRRDVDDVTGVVNDLIAEARSSLAGVSESCDAAPVVTGRVEFWAALAEDTGRPWSFERGHGLMRVPVSEAALEAALDVLIENVFSHTSDEVPFTVGFEATAEQVRIWVGDGGSGFGDDEAQRGVSGSGSTGLGLDIARSTARDAGGVLEIGVSDLGGSEVSMRLPRLAAAAEGSTQ